MQCPICRMIYSPMVYQTGYKTVAEHFHGREGGIYLYVVEDPDEQLLGCALGWLAQMEPIGRLVMNGGTGQAAAVRVLAIEARCMGPSIRPHELATICHVRFGRRPSPHTVKRILAEGGTPSRAGRRYPAYEQITHPAERRLAVVRLHAEGWTVTTIAAYLQTSRARIYEVLKRWIAEGVRGLDDKSHTPKNPARKVNLKAMAAIRRLQANPELGEFRVHAALAQLSIHLSPRTCGRILALNRTLYGLPRPSSAEPHEKKPMPFAAQRRHQYWSVDVRYIEDNKVSDKHVYVIAVLENFSRAMCHGLGDHRGC